MIIQSIADKLQTMRKIMFVITLLLAFYVVSGHVLAQTSADPETSQMLNNYLQSKQAGQSQTNQNTNQAQQSTQQTQNVSSTKSSVSSWTLFVMILYSITFLLIWFFLIMWIFTLFRWAKQKPRSPIEIGKRMN